MGLSFATEDTNSDFTNTYADDVILEDSLNEYCLDSNIALEEDSQEINAADEDILESSESNDNVFNEGQHINTDDDDPQTKFIRDGSQITVWSTKFEYIQAAIDYANENDTIVLLWSSEGNGSQIIVNKSVTIEPHWDYVTLDAKGQSRIFCILSDNVVLKNLRLINGFQNISDDEPIILINLDTTINDSDASTSTQSSDDPNLQGKGGAIKWVGNNGSLINCTLTDNCLIANVRENGNTISWLGENGRIINSFFELNQAHGTIFISGDMSISNVIDSPVRGVYYGDLDERVFFADVGVNFKPVIILKNVSTYYKSGEKVSFSLKANGIKCVNETMTILISRSYCYIEPFNVTSDSNGVISFKLPKSLNIGKWKLEVYHIGDDYNRSAFSYITVKKIPAKVSLSKYATYYNSGKKFTFKLLNSKTNKTVPNTNLYLTVDGYKAGTAEYFIKTDKYGKVSLDLSKFSVGKHKVCISGSYDDVLTLSKTTTITISKGKSNVKLSKNSFKYKKSDKLKVTITDKRTKKPIKNTKVTVKVYTGKKYKTYNLKTNKKGTIQINTKNLKKGTHKIIIGSKNKNYKISKKASIKIK
jgi:hypothetical protein